MSELHCRQTKTPAGPRNVRQSTFEELPGWQTAGALSAIHCVVGRSSGVAIENHQTRRQHHATPGALMAG
jgi:hypothetical protein